MAEEKKDNTQQVEDINEEKFFDDVLDDPEEENEQPKQETESEEPPKEEETEEEKNKRSQKNKDAEEARKRREAEAKAKKALEQKKAKEKEDAEKAKSAKEKQTETLGKQLEDFKKDYPDVDLKALDSDKSFKKFIDGKLLGRKDFKGLYKDYLEFRSELTGKSEDELESDYRVKAQASSGSTTSKQDTGPNEDVYSEQEYNDIVAKLPFMLPEEAEKVLDKLDRSTKYYAKKN